MFSAEVILHHYSLAQVFEDPHTTLQAIKGMTKSQKITSLAQEICLRNCSSGQPLVLSKSKDFGPPGDKRNRPGDHQHDVNATYDESDAEPPYKHFKQEPQDMLSGEDYHYIEDESLYGDHDRRDSRHDKLQDYDQHDQYNEHYDSFCQQPQHDMYSHRNDYGQKFGRDDNHHYSAGLSQQFPQKRDACIAFKDQSPEMEIYDDVNESGSPRNRVRFHEKNFACNDDLHFQSAQSPETHMQFHRDDHFHSPDQFHTPENLMTHRNMESSDPYESGRQLRYDSLKKRRLGLQKPRFGEKQTKCK